jgi:hypothetical protein
MDNLFQRLRAYTVVPPPQSSKDLNEEIMLTVLSILTSVTEEITQGRARKSIPRMFLVICLSLIRKVLEEVRGKKCR